MIDNRHYLILSYSDQELRNLIEEYIIQQKAEFTFEGVCSFIAYWAMEDGMKAGNNKIQPNDQERVRRVLEAIIRDGRITASGETYNKA